MIFDNSNDAASVITKNLFVLKTSNLFSVFQFTLAAILLYQTQYLSVNFLVRASVPFARFNASIPLLDSYNGRRECVNLKAMKELNFHDVVRDEGVMLLTGHLFFAIIELQKNQGNFILYGMV